MANPGPASTISPHQLLQADSSDGYQIGTLSTTPIGMYGATPVAQRSNANQLTVSAAATSGTLLSVQAIALSPAGVGINTTLSQAIAVTGAPILTSDFLVVNKPSHQANLAIINARPHTATAGTVVLQYFNMSTATITPTASEQYQFQLFRGLANSISLTPSVVAANSVSEQTFNVTGVAVGMLAMVSKPSEQVGLGIGNVRIPANNQLAIQFINVSSGAITPAAGESYSYFASAGLAANSNLMLWGVNVGTQLTPPVTTTTQSWQVTEQSVTVSGILATDIFVGISKPSAQATFGIVGGRITTANIVNLAFGSGTVTGITPTAAEVYAVTIYRQNPNPPLTVVSVTVAPTGIAAFTTNEQAFTVTPAFPVGSMCFVNKPTLTANCTVVGARVSAAGVVAIAFANTNITSSAVTVVPPSEVYLIGNFQPSTSSGSYVSMQVANSLIGANMQGNELRLAMANIGMITGGTP
jgi:hypothetical protein